MIRAVIVEDIDLHHATPGAVEIREVEIEGERSVGFAFICPCGCGREGYLPTDTLATAPRWDWNGDRDRPSLTPSVQFVGGCAWHGYLTDGEWRSC